jgi:hypothetical protein
MADEQYKQERAYKELSEHVGKQLAIISGELGPDAMVVIIQRLVEELYTLAAASEEASDADWDRKANPGAGAWDQTR